MAKLNETHITLKIEKNTIECISVLNQKKKEQEYLDDDDDDVQYTLFLLLFIIEFVCM